jgi:hypothetical protein
MYTLAHRRLCLRTAILRLLAHPTTTPAQVQRGCSRARDLLGRSKGTSLSVQVRSGCRIKGYLLLFHLTAAPPSSEERLTMLIWGLRGYSPGQEGFGLSKAANSLGPVIPEPLGKDGQSHSPPMATPRSLADGLTTREQACRDWRDRSAAGIFCCAVG